MIKTNNNYTDYILVILSIWTINPFFSNALLGYNLVFLVIVFTIAYIRKVRLLDIKIATLFFLIYVLIAFQCIYYRAFSPAALYKPFIIIYAPYLIYRLMGVSYFKYFNMILVVIVLYTTPLWLLQSFVPSFDHFLRTTCEAVFENGIGWNVVPKSLLFYTSPWSDHLFNETLGIYRNSGIFHEPGAYGIMLNIGIVSNTLIKGKLFDKVNTLFIIAIITTLSTTAYITIFIIISFFLYKSQISQFLKYPLIIIFILFSIQIYTQTDFLKEKVETQYEEQTYAAEKNYGKDRDQSGRFYAFITATKEFLENPVTGRGIIDKTSKRATGEMNAGAAYGYGFIGVFMVFGLPFGLYYVLLMYRGFKQIGKESNQTKSSIIVSFIAVNLALLTQIFVMSTMVVVIVMIGMYSKKTNLKIRTRHKVE